MNKSFPSWTQLFQTGYIENYICLVIKAYQDVGAESRTAVKKEEERRTELVEYMRNRKAEFYITAPIGYEVGERTKRMDICCYLEGLREDYYICFECKNNVLPKYLEYFFKTDIFTYEMKKRLEGSVRMCLSYESMLNIPIDLPDIIQQERISKVLNEVDKRINCEEIKYDYQQKLKDGLLQKMFI